MTTIPNSRKIPTSIIFLNLDSLFSNYCKTETAIHLLHFTNNSNIISIIDNQERIIDIEVTDTDVHIIPLNGHDHLFDASKKFIHSLIA